MNSIHKKHVTNQPASAANSASNSECKARCVGLAANARAFEEVSKLAEETEPEEDDEYDAGDE